MEEAGDASPAGGGIAMEPDSVGGATNLQRSRSIPEPISDPHDINNSGMLEMQRSWQFPP